MKILMYNRINEVKKIKGKFIDIFNIEVILLFLYLTLFYIFGSHSDTVIYSKIILVFLFFIEIVKIVKNGKIKTCIPFIMMIVFAIFCFLSNFWAINSSLSVAKGMTLIKLTMFSLVIYNIFAHHERGTEYLIKIIMYAGFVLSIYVIFYYGFFNYFTRLALGERMGEEIDNVNTIGIAAAISFIIAFFCGVSINKKYYLFTIFPFIVALGSGCRKALAIIIIGIVVILLYKFKQRINIKTIFKALIVICIFIVIITILSRLVMFSKTFLRFSKMINGFLGKGNVDNSTKVRLKFIKYGMEQFKETPLLGIGIDNSGYITVKSGESFTYLHNNYIELLATVGIIGFFLYYQIYIYINKMYKKI